MESEWLITPQRSSGNAQALTSLIANIAALTAGGSTVELLPGSSMPHVVRVPMSDPAAVDPQEAFVASLSSCHMLWFLDLASRANFVVDEYRDVALGTMAKNTAGKLAMKLVVLRPEVAFSGRQPTAEEFSRTHHQAHEECFIAASVRTEVRCEPIIRAL
jgi:organic hydroperoxide reductase OsmC/OhrA